MNFNIMLTLTMYYASNLFIMHLNTKHENEMRCVYVLSLRIFQEKQSNASNFYAIADILRYYNPFSRCKMRKGYTWTAKLNFVLTYNQGREELRMFLYLLKGIAEETSLSMKPDDCETGDFFPLLSFITLCCMNNCLYALFFGENYRNDF